MKIKLPDGTETIVQTDNFQAFGIGMFESVKYTKGEVMKVTEEMFTKPFHKKEGKFFHSVILCSFFQFVGPVIAFFGAHKTGAFFRDLFGALLDVGYILDPTKKKGERSYLPGGICWIGSAICDYGKRIGFIEERISNLTQLSNTFDPLAGIFESLANFGRGQEGVTTSNQIERSPSDSIPQYANPA